MAHEKWQNSQVRVLIELGVNPVDAQASVDWVLKHLPDGSDPATYIFPASVLFDNLTAREVIADARIAWFADDSIPAKFKRLLDARAI